jgi:hypothetical protein
MREDKRPAETIEFQREVGLFRGIFVVTDEFAEGHWKARAVAGAEGVHAKLNLKPDHDDSEAERIQPRVEEGKTVGQGGKPQVLLPGYLPELRDHFRFDIHTEIIDLPRLPFTAPWRRVPE